MWVLRMLFPIIRMFMKKKLQERMLVITTTKGLLEVG